MLRRVVVVLSFAFVAGSLLGGSDPWKAKPYKEWSAEDIQKIMSDSPWARPVSVTASWRPSSASAITPTIGQERGPTGARPTGDTSGSADPGNAQNQASFVVRWQSSLTLRQALVRSAELRGTPAEKAEQMLGAQPESYVIDVWGQDMTPFTKTDEMALKQKTYLLVKKTKQKLTPDRVEFRRMPNGQKVLDILFYFAKNSANGEATIPGDEKQLEFACETPVTRIKATFDLAKMSSGKGGPDL